MIKWFNEPIPEFNNTVLTMGNFDGMHLGHRKVISELINKAGQLQATPVVISYLEHPGHYIHFKHPVSILTPRFLRKDMFNEMGIKHVYFLNFTAETAHTSATDFLKNVIIRFFKPGLIISGYDSHFGYQREGNTELLKDLEEEFDYRTIKIEPVYYKENIISSSLIREKLTDGNLRDANAMLGNPYRIYGTVTYGKKIGRTIGFPTINLSLMDIEQLIPANGIYLSSLLISGKKYFGLTNIGTSPTLKNMAQIEIETHILDFNQEIYDTNICLELMDFIREERTFSSIDELRKAITEDIKHGRELISRL